MVMAQVAHRWTRDDILALPEDGNRYELVDGELLVTPAPRRPHQRAVAELFRQLDPFVREHAVGELMISPADVEARPGEWYQPDLFVERLVAGRPARDWNQGGIPRLIIEVSSPSTARYDRSIKRPAFQDAGVEEFWIVDLEARLVERWLPNDPRPEILIDTLVWQPDGVASLTIDLRALFRSVLE